MFKLEGLLKGASLRPKDITECRIILREHRCIKLRVCPGHIFLCYGENKLDNVQSFDTISSTDAWFNHQRKSKKAYLKLKNLQSPVLDLIFPGCCLSPVVWVVLQNGIVFIWSFTRSRNEGPRWLPTGQFFITDTSEYAKCTLESVLMHKKSGNFLWTEISDIKQGYNIKRMSLPSDVRNINYGSGMSHVSMVLQNCPKCHLSCVGESVIFNFVPPSPPGIICTWQYPSRLNMLKLEFEDNKCRSVWKSDLTHQLIDFREISMKISRFWSCSNLKNTNYEVYAYIEHSNEAIIVMNSGQILTFLTSGNLKELFHIQNFKVKNILGCFIYMKMLCIISHSQYSMYKLENGRVIENREVFPTIKYVFEHSCCIDTIGMVLEDGSALRLCASNPNELFKSRNRHAPLILKCLNQHYFEFLTRLHLFAVNGDTDHNNIKIIVEKLLSDPSAQHEIMICLIEQMIRNSKFSIQSIMDNISHRKPDMSILDRSQVCYFEYFNDLTALTVKVIENSS